MKKRLSAGLLALCMVLLLGLAGCRGQNTPTTPAGEGTTAGTTPAATDGTEDTTTQAEGQGEQAPATWENLSWEKDTSPITFDCYIDFDWFGTDTFGEDDVSREITRLTGVNLNVTKGTDPQILGALIAAQNLPDLVQTDRLFTQFESEDVCYAWNKLIPEYCPEFLELIDPLEMINNEAADGNFYTLKNVYKDDRCYNDPNSLAHFGNNFMGYRLDIMEKLQLPMFTSIEELDQTFYTVKEHQDELGLASIYQPHPSWGDVPLAWWMGIHIDNYWDSEAKQIKTTWSDDGWLDYYRLMNKWYRDGILAQDYLSIRPEDFFQRVNTASTFCYQYNQGIPNDANLTMYDAGLGGKYDDLSKPCYALMVEPLAYQGDNTRWNHVLVDYGTGWAATYISATCKNPDRAICYMEFLKSPQGDELTFFGIEGTDWEWATDGGIRYTQAKRDKIEEDPQYKFGTGWWYFMGSYWAEGMGTTIAYNEAKARAEKGDDRSKYQMYGLEQQMQMRTVMKAISRSNKNPAMSFARVEASDDDNYATYVKLADYWNTLRAKLISAESEAALEKAWDEGRRYMEANGLKTVEQVMTENYVTNLKRYQDAGFFTDIATE